MSNFKTVELVPPHVYTMLGENARNLIAPEVIAIADALRDALGLPLIPNSTKRGRTASGLRTPSCKHYSKTSQHSGNQGHHDNKCCALDMITQVDVRYYHAWILRFRHEYPELENHLTFMEIDISWLHVDVRPGMELKLWSPKRKFVSIETYIKELKQGGYWDFHIPVKE